MIEMFEITKTLIKMSQLFSSEKNLVWKLWSCFNEQYAVTNLGV